MGIVRAIGLGMIALLSTHGFINAMMQHGKKKTETRNIFEYAISTAILWTVILMAVYG